MGLLLYKSNEMFSATELIRKSKMIFDKIVNDEIDKAIILRDGKPGFLLMDFAKYESIMAEYEDLKKLVENTKPKKDLLKSKKIKKEKEKEFITKSIETQNPMSDKETLFEKTTEIEKENKSAAFVVPPRPKEEEVIIEDDISDDIPIEQNTQQEDISIQKEEQNDISEDEELKSALERLKSIDFDDEMRAVAEQKIKDRLKMIREERATKLVEQTELEKEDLKEELELQVHIKEENKKKERELKEFWD